MKYVSYQLLECLYQQTEQHLNLAIAEWQQLPASSLNSQPGLQQWSAIQCLEHLNVYGRFYLPAIQKALQTAGNTAPTATFKSGWLGNYFFQLMQTNGNGQPKKRMKAPRNARPATLLNETQVLQTFISQLEELLRLLEMAKKVNLSKARVPISIAPFIRLQLGDALLFYTAHIHRHVWQAQRALQAKGGTGQTTFNLNKRLPLVTQPG